VIDYLLSLKIETVCPISKLYHNKDIMQTRQ